VVLPDTISSLDLLRKSQTPNHGPLKGIIKTLSHGVFFNFLSVSVTPWFKGELTIIFIYLCKRSINAGSLRPRFDCTRLAARSAQREASPLLFLCPIHNRTEACFHIFIASGDRHTDKAFTLPAKC